LLEKVAPPGEKLRHCFCVASDYARQPINLSKRIATHYYVAKESDIRLSLIESQLVGIRSCFIAVFTRNSYIGLLMSSAARGICTFPRNFYDCRRAVITFIFQFKSKFVNLFDETASHP